MVKSVTNAGLIIMPSVCDQDPSNRGVLKNLINETASKNQNIFITEYEADGIWISPIYDVQYINKF